MATDRKNQKICRVPPDKDIEFQQSVPAPGSIYYRPQVNALVVGDGETPGGQEFVSRQWVLQKIEEANWKVIASQEAFNVKTEAINPGTIVKKADSALSPSVFVGFSVTTSATATVGS